MLDLSRLSAEQREVVLAPDGPLLIVAGPGSGKTMVLAAKIAYLVGWRQIPPTSILAITFATKAARELRARLCGLLGEQGVAVDVSTFHAFGLRIVRQWSVELELGPGPLTVYGEKEARAVLREVATNLQIDPDRYPLLELSAQLERQRLEGKRAASERGTLQEMADAYQEMLRRRGAVDPPCWRCRSGSSSSIPARCASARTATGSCCATSSRTSAPASMPCSALLPRGTTT